MSFILSQFVHLGPLQIRYYSLFMVLAILTGYAFALWRAKKSGIDQGIFDNIVFWTIIIAFLCARLYYVIFYPQYYVGNPGEIYKIWHGGLAIYGSLIGGAAALFYFSRKYKIKFLKIADVLIVGLPLAQAIGRFGNLFNYEAFGNPTNLPWKMFVPEMFRPVGYENFAYFHPTFAYEAIWDLLVFALLLWIARKQDFWIAGEQTSREKAAREQTPNPRSDMPIFAKTGFLSAVYALSYSIGRFFIESIRLDSAYFGSLRGDQVTAVIMIALAGIVLWRLAYK